MPHILSAQTMPAFTFLPWLRGWALPLVWSSLSAVVLTGLLVRIAATTGWVAAQRQDDWKERVVARFGGIPILLAFSSAAIFLPASHETRVLMLLTGAMGIVGLLGDLLGLDPRLKLLGQILMAMLAVKMGILQVLSGHFWTDATFTVLWIVAITNAVLLLDNMDGLAAGIAIIASAQIALFAGPADPVTGLTVCMLAALAGYLFFNFSPAKVFMGNVGTFAIGFFLACASIKTAQHISSLSSLLFVPCTVLFIPFFDTLLVSITRRMSGKAISRKAQDHTSHRLVLAGLTQRKAVALLYIIAIIAGMMAFLEKSYWGDVGPGLVALFLIAATLFWVYLAKLQLPATWLSEANVTSSALSEFLPQLVTRLAVILLDALVMIVGLYFAFLIVFGRMNRPLVGALLFTWALCIAVKVTMLMAYGAYQRGWDLKGKKHILSILSAMVTSAFVLAVVSIILPPGKVAGLTILMLDAVLSSTLLILVRASTAILDGFFRMSRFAARNQFVVENAPKPKVVRIIGRLNGGGPARQACLLHEKLADKFETHLVIGSLAEGEQDMSYLLHSERNVLRLPQMSRKISPWADAIAFWRLLQFLARIKPGIVHTHTAKAGGLGRLAAWLVGVPVIVHTYHGHVFHGYFGPLKTRIYLGIERLMGHLSTQMITVSDSQKEELCRKYHVALPEHISVIYNGVELERFSDPCRDQARTSLGLSPDSFVAVWAGRMVPVKDVHLLAQLVQLASQRQKKIHFLVVGDGTEKPKLLSSLRGYTNVHFLGWQQHIEKIWFAADVAILTSRNEGTPTNLVEAMAAKIPFVATHVGGVQDLAVVPLRELPAGMGYEAANGFLTARTPEALLHCIEKLITEPELAVRMGNMGHAFAWERFSVPEMVGKTTSLYQSLLAKSDKFASVPLRPSERKASQAEDAG